MSYSKSKKGFTLVEIMIVVVIIALLAIMAIPAFKKVRDNSRKSVITNNLRQVAGAGQQYLLENGVSSVAYASLTPTYFPTIQPVAGETYTGLTIADAGGTLTVTTSSGTTVTFRY